MYLYVLDFLEPWALFPSGCCHFSEGLGPTHSRLRVCSVISHVHPELLTPLYSVQVISFSIIFTVAKYPYLTLVPVLNNTSQTLMGFKSY